MDCMWMGIDPGAPDGDKTVYAAYTNGLTFPEELDTDFTIGDVVSLIVGGPDMVVVDVCEDCGSVEVVWVQPDGFVMRDAFPEEALIEVA